MGNELFRIEDTVDSPLVVVNADVPQVIIRGISMPENAFEFFNPIELRIMEFLQNMGDDVMVEIELSYLNSMSGKQILQLIRKIKSAHGNLRISWKYKNEDELIRIKGEDLKRICPTISIELISILTP